MILDYHLKKNHDEIIFQDSHFSSDDVHRSVNDKKAFFLVNYIWICWFLFAAAFSIIVVCSIIKYNYPS